MQLSSSDPSLHSDTPLHTKKLARHEALALRGSTQRLSPSEQSTRMKKVGCDGNDQNKVATNWESNYYAILASFPAYAYCTLKFKVGVKVWSKLRVRMRLRYRVGI